MIHTFDELFAAAKKISKERARPMRVIVAGGNDTAAIAALIEARTIGIADGVLVGDPALIWAQLRELGLPPDTFEIIEAMNEKAICSNSIQAILDGQGEIILKGSIKTPDLLKAAFNPKSGLRIGKIISDIFLFEFSGRSDKNKLLMITDGGFNLAPDLNEKIQLIENCVTVAHALGNENPKVAILSSVETINPNLQSITDAAVITKMNQRGQIKGCVVDGPLALDNAISKEAAQIKKIDSPVAGEADILLCPNIESANMMAKATTYFANLKQAHATMGAKAPVLVPSRNDSAEAKLRTLALNVVVCAHSDANES